MFWSHEGCACLFVVIVWRWCPIKVQWQDSFRGVQSNKINPCRAISRFNYAPCPPSEKYLGNFSEVGASLLRTLAPSWNCDTYHRFWLLRTFCLLSENYSLASQKWWCNFSEVRGRLLRSLLCVSFMRLASSGYLYKRSWAVSPSFPSNRARELQK